jgi:hypothetical protein
MISEKQIEDLGIKNWAALSKRFDNADILLGNGFSINLAGHFNYKSLFEEFLKNCKPKERAIFQSFDKRHFELIQESLISAKNVNKWLDIKDPEKKIENAINALRNGLIESIGKTHPKAVNVDFNQLRSLSLQLNNFNDIYTLNYDLFLYHIIMQMKDEAERKKQTCHIVIISGVVNLQTNISISWILMKITKNTFIIFMEHCSFLKYPLTHVN